MMRLGDRVQLDVADVPSVRGTLLAWAATTDHDGVPVKNVLLGDVERYNQFGDFWDDRRRETVPIVVRTHSHLKNRKLTAVT